MGRTSHNANHFTGRRQFLKGLFSLGGIIETTSLRASGEPVGQFYCAYLRTGQIGFPTGTAVNGGLPGSLMKLIASAAFREENLIAANAIFECTGGVKVRGKSYVCQLPHGRLSLTQALGYSCNVFFAQAAELLSPGLFLKYARLFGLDQSLADFSSGSIPALSSGQSQALVLGLSTEFQPNALQILRMVALVGRQGSLPYLHSADQPSTVGEPFHMSLSEATWGVFHQGMQIASREGTAKKLDPENHLHLAAKTGTAPHGNSFQSWVAGYFPYDAPRYAFCARAHAGTSQDAAVPLARKYLFATDWP